MDAFLCTKTTIGEGMGMGSYSPASCEPNPSAGVSAASCAPTLDVMMSTVFLKDTTRPRLSVRRPSSRICKRMLNTSGCAFSISSNKTTEYGLRRMRSVSCPPAASS